MSLHAHNQLPRARHSLAAMLLLWLCAASAWGAAESVSLHYAVINNFPVKYVIVDMNDPEVVVTTALARPFPTGLESWGSLIGRLRPDAAINGTYFCLRTNMPVGDVAVNGSLLYRGVVGTALCITPDNQVTLLPGPQQRKPNWEGFRSVLCAGPRLLTAGKVTVHARAEGFRDPHVLGSAPRSAVAYRPDGKLILLTIAKSLSLQNLAYVCIHLGATEAMALDGGTSSALYADGRTVTRPGRSLSTVLAVYATPAKYYAAVDEFVPGALPVLASLLPTVPSTAVATTPAPMPAVTPRDPGLVRIVHPAPTQAVTGLVPITVQVSNDRRLCWASLRINGQLRAMSNVWPLEYHWDSNKEREGIYTLEAIVWSQDRTLLAHDVMTVTVQHPQRVAER